MALRFFAPTHAAKLKRAKPSGFSRFMRQPHKVGQLMWSEYRFEGELLTLREDGCEEAYQMVSMRGDDPLSKWKSARWKLVKVETDYGESVSAPTWMVEAVFADEPDTAEDIEFLRAHTPECAPGAAAAEPPTAVVEKVMRALRRMDEPTPLHGAEMATRFCSPRNRASELSPEVFARYLQDPWYSVLAEWDHFDLDDDFDEADAAAGAASVEVMVRRDADDDAAMVAWELSLYDGQWLIDSLNIIS